MLCILANYSGSEALNSHSYSFVCFFLIYFSACQCILLSICCFAVLFSGLVCHYIAPPQTFIMSVLVNVKYLLSGKEAKPFMADFQPLMPLQIAIYTRWLSVL